MAACDHCGEPATHTGWAYPPGGSFPVIGCMPCLEDLVQDGVEVHVRPLDQHPQDNEHEIEA